MSPMRRLVAVLSIVALAAVACTNRKDTEITPQPTDATRVEQVAEFQLVGTIEKALAGVETPIDVPDDDVAVSGPTSSPSETPVGDAPTVPGVLRMEIEDVNEDLADECRVAEGQDIRVYWTTDTKFDPSDGLEEAEQH